MKSAAQPRVRILSASLAAALVITVTAHAARTDKDRYQSHVSGFAIPQDGGKLDRSRMCLCRSDDYATKNVPGYLYFIERPVTPHNVVVLCAVVEFDEAGSIENVAVCNEFAPL